MLGQSFGGFTTLTYLSFAPEGLREALITGGLSPVGRSADDVYGATYGQAAAALERYYARYPGRPGPGPRRSAPASTARTCACPAATG